MLKANVGLSRKVSKDYQSTGYTINLEGEIAAPVSDPEAVIEQVKELYDLAEEALDLQIERSTRIDRQAQHDEPNENRSATPTPRPNSNGSPPSDAQHDSEEQSATEKQINFLLTLGKRQKFSTAKLEERIAEVLGRPVGIYDLTKRQAALVLNELTGNGHAAKAGRG